MKRCFSFFKSTGCLGSLLISTLLTVGVLLLFGMFRQVRALHCMQSFRNGNGLPLRIRWIQPRYTGDRSSLMRDGVFTGIKPLVPSTEPFAIPCMSGTGHAAPGYPRDLLNRISTGILEKYRSLLIGHGNWSLHDLQDQTKSERQSRSFAMPSRKEPTRARERLQSVTPISDDASLQGMEEEAAQYIREARRRDATDADELVSTVVEAVARNYFRHALHKQRRRARE